MNTASDNPRPRKDGKPTHIIDRESDQIYFINSADSSFTGTMPDGEEAPDLQDTVDLFMRSKALRPPQERDQTKVNANSFEISEWWPLKAQSETLEEEEQPIDHTTPNAQLSLPQVDAEPQSTSETFDYSAVDPLTFLHHWNIADRGRQLKEELWAAASELQTITTRVQANKKAWQKDLLLRQFIRDIQHKLRHGYVFVLQILSPIDTTKVSACSHPFCDSDKGKLPVATLSGTALGNYRMTLEPAIYLQLPTIPDMLIEVNAKPSYSVRKSRQSLSPGTGEHCVQWFCLTCVEDLFYGKDLLDSASLKVPNDTKSKIAMPQMGSTRQHKRAQSTSPRRESAVKAEHIAAATTRELHKKGRLSVEADLALVEALEEYAESVRAAALVNGNGELDRPRTRLRLRLGPRNDSEIENRNLPKPQPTISQVMRVPSERPGPKPVASKTSTSAREAVKSDQAPAGNDHTTCGGKWKPQRRTAHTPGRANALRKGEGQKLATPDGADDEGVKTRFGKKAAKSRLLGGNIDQNPASNATIRTSEAGEVSNLKGAGEDEIETWFDRRDAKRRLLEGSIKQNPPCDADSQRATVDDSSHRSAQSPLPGFSEHDNTVDEKTTSAQPKPGPENQLMARPRRGYHPTYKLRSAADRPHSCTTVHNKDDTLNAEKSCEPADNSVRKPNGQNRSRRRANPPPSQPSLIRSDSLTNVSLAPEPTLTPRQSSPLKRKASSSVSLSDSISRTPLLPDTITQPPPSFGPLCPTSSSPLPTTNHGLTPFHQLSSFIHPETRSHPSGYFTLSTCQRAALEKWKSEIDKTLMLRHKGNRRFMERNGLLWNYPGRKDSNHNNDEEQEAEEEDEEGGDDGDGEEDEDEDQEEEDEMDIRLHGAPLNPRKVWIRPRDGPLRGVMEEGGKIVELSAREVQGAKLSDVMRRVDERVKVELKGLGKEWDR